MELSTAVALYLTILMVVLCAITLIGGHINDQKQGGAKKESD